MNPFVDIEDEFQRAGSPAMPEDMRSRVLQAIRNEKAITNKSIRNSRKWVSWVSVAAGVFIAGTVATWIVQQSHGVGATHHKLVTTANLPAPTSLATTVPIVGKHVSKPHMAVVYPQVEGLPNSNVQKRINGALKRASMPNNPQQVSDTGSFASSYQVTFEQGNLIDVFISTHTSYSNMADGGSQTASSLIFNLANGKQYHFADLFTMTALTDLNKMVRQTDTMHVRTAAPSVQGTDTLVLTDEGVKLVFKRGSWSASTSGTTAFLLKTTQLSKLVIQRSPVWASLVAADRSQSFTDLQADAQFVQTHGYRIASKALFRNQINLTSVRLPLQGVAKPIYAVIGISQKSSPAILYDPIEKIFFFQGTKYVGTDTTKAHGAVANMYVSSRYTIHIDYVKGNFPTTRTFGINYKWNGYKLVPTAAFPADYTDWH